jgi:4'-phosphopantetheinyl transferase
VLAPEEREQTERFRFDDDRNAYRAAHALRRMALSSIEPAIPPRAWAFETTAHGRPEIDSASELPRLRFNISHTRGLVACVVTRHIECGIDVESISRFRDLGHLAPSILAPAELTQWTTSARSDQPQLLSRYWTIKEAYSKALGLGMSLPFQQIAFDLTEGGPQLSKGSDVWQFDQWLPVPNYVAALALRGNAPVQITRWAGLPEVLAPISQ